MWSHWPSGASVFDGDFDNAMLPTVIAAENARTPTLQLVSLSDPSRLKAWLDDEQFPPEGKRALLPLPLPGGLVHIVVADARRNENRTSLFIIDPLTPNAGRAEAFGDVLLPALRASISGDTTLTMLMLGTQKARVGCRIFALSAASKLAAQKEKFDALHEQNVSGQPLTTSQGGDARKWAGDERIRLVGGEGIVTPAFMKHSQSRSTLRNWADANPPGDADAVVNRQGQTLLSRYEANVTERYRRVDIHALGRSNPDPLPRDWTDLLRSSTSIERKRLVYIDRAIAYLRRAPRSESQALLDRFNALDPSRRDVGNLGLESRQLGPRPWG